MNTNKHSLDLTLRELLDMGAVLWIYFHNVDMKVTSGSKAFERIERFSDLGVAPEFDQDETRAGVGNSTLKWVSFDLPSLQITSFYS